MWTLSTTKGMALFQVSMTLGHPSFVSVLFYGYSLDHSAPNPAGALPRTPPKGLSPFEIPQYFCRSVDVTPRKQGMSEGSVLAHVTDANDEADEGGAPLSEQKRG